MQEIVELKIPTISNCGKSRIRHAFGIPSFHDVFRVRPLLDGDYNFTTFSYQLVHPVKLRKKWANPEQIATKRFSVSRFFVLLSNVANNKNLPKSDRRKIVKNVAIVTMSVF
jgi:hypothetical protein